MPAKENELAQLQEQSSKPEFWADPDNARTQNRKIARLSEPIEQWKRLSSELDDLELLTGLVEDDQSAEAAELVTEFDRISKELDQWEFQRMMRGPDDKGNCIVSIHAGAGGTESADWASMLLRMFMRYFERNRFKAEIIDLQPGEQAGIKSASIEVAGNYAFGYLQTESGVHRLVRISPFDSNARRHTSFASVFVFPESEEADEIVINPNDLRIDTFRASGAGGQHINKTDSAIRITHLPTNTVVTCQAERSQHKNKDSAMRFLKAKLLKLQRDEEAKKRDVLEATKAGIAWGSQIRSYVLHPYKMVKDHRTDIETSNTDAVLDGDIDLFINGYLYYSAGIVKGET